MAKRPGEEDSNDDSTEIATPLHKPSKVARKIILITVVTVENNLGELNNLVGYQCETTTTWINFFRANVSTAVFQLLDPTQYEVKSLLGKVVSPLTDTLEDFLSNSKKARNSITIRVVKKEEVVVAEEPREQNVEGDNNNNDDYENKNNVGNNNNDENNNGTEGQCPQLLRAEPPVPFQVVSEAGVRYNVIRKVPQYCKVAVEMDEKSEIFLNLLSKNGPPVLRQVHVRRKRFEKDDLSLAALLASDPSPFLTSPNQLYDGEESLEDLTNLFSTNEAAGAPTATEVEGVAYVADPDETLMNLTFTEMGMYNEIDVESETADETFQEFLRASIVDGRRESEPTVQEQREEQTPSPLNLSLDEDTADIDMGCFDNAENDWESFI